MKCMINKTLSFILAISFIVLPAVAFELDTSVDEEIRKNYNPSAIEKTLPSLPKTSPSKSSASSQTSLTPPKKLPTADTSRAKIRVKNMPNTYSAVIDKSTAIRIKKGTKFKVKSNAYLADTTRTGATFNFTTLAPVTQRYVTIPTGTVFSAIVTDSHSPQITGNGGLLEIAVTGVNHNGSKFYANGKVTKANYKKIFFNNIKGKHQYWKGVAKQVNRGQNFYNKTQRATNKLASNPFGKIISPIPIVFGTVVYAFNFIGSPIFAIGSKGGKLSIPAGSVFEIKLLEDVYLQQ